MKQIFRTYSSLDASIFDLMSGTNEVKQTTGLAFLLSKDKDVLQAFFNLGEVRRIVNKVRIKDYDKVVVHSELTSVNRKRADITIQLYKNNKPAIALIIEAKSVKVNSSSKSVVQQLSGYLKADEFSDLRNFELYGCALTKNDLIIQDERITAIAWSRIFEMSNSRKGLAVDYLKFVSKIKGAMKFYEKEVYSVPVGNTSELQYQYPNIYECPNEGKYVLQKKPLFMAFRKRLGIMETLFGVDEILIMNPKTDYSSFMKNDSYTDETKKRVTDYCNSWWGEGNYDDQEKQFFILSQTNQINLKHKPRPKRNNAFRAYYQLSELLNEDNIIVEPHRD
jgi:hypothetical protein